MAHRETACAHWLLLARTRQGSAYSPGVRSLTFPHFAEGRRGTYLTEAKCQAICARFQARVCAAVKADVFPLAYLTVVRKGLRRTTKRHVHIQGDVWKLVWPKEDTKNGRP